MEIIELQHPIQSSGAVRDALPKTLAIGHFDGVHKGHRNVIGRSVAAGREAGLQAAVMTFDPHPRKVLGQGEQYLTCLTPIGEKVERFRQLGADIVYIVNFDLPFSSVTPAGFVDDVLRPLQVKKAVVGFDFSFGSRGAGDAEMLSSLGQPDIEVEVVEPLLMNGRKISSTLVREALAEGAPEMAEQLLGEPYHVRGTVVRGEGRGRTIGFPTANLEPDDDYVIPRQGVYAIMAEVAGERFPGVLNIGVKPTFHEHLPKPVLEAHLLDYSGDLYDQPVRLTFVTFLRSEQRFGSVDELIRQIHADAERARTVLAAYK